MAINIFSTPQHLDVPRDWSLGIAAFRDPWRRAVMREALRPMSDTEKVEQAILEPTERLGDGSHQPAEKSR